MVEIESIINEIDIINTTNDISIEDVENNLSLIQEENNIEIEVPENNLQLIFNQNGADAKINGYNTVEIIAGDNITIEQDEEELTISATGEPQVQTDFAQTDNTKVDYIKNKPTKLSYFTVDLDTDDIPETTTNMYVPTLPTATPQAKYLNGNKEWQEISVGSGGYSANLYFTTKDSDITGYKKIEYIAEATETELTIPCTTVEVLARIYLYDYGLDTTVIDAGRWLATYRAKVSSNKGATIRFEAFLRHIDNSETILFSDSSDLIINTTYATLNNEVTQPIFNCLATDRLGVRIYASTTHPAGVTLNTIIGDGNGSYFTTPLSIRHNQLRDLNGDIDYLHITSAEKAQLGKIIHFVDTYADLADLDSSITKAIVKTDTLADRTYTTLDGSTQYEVLYVNPLPPLYGETYEDTYFLSTGAGGTGTIQGQVEASEDDGFRLWTLQLSGIYLGAVALAVQQNYIGGEFEISFNGKTNIRLGGGWIDNLAYVDTATDEVLDITMYDKKPDTVSAFLTCYITPASNDATNWHRVKYALQPTPFEINYSGVYEKIDDTWTLVVKNDKLVNGNIGLPLPS